jgi:hypothetical protein
VIRTNPSAIEEVEQLHDDLHIDTGCSGTVDDWLEGSLHVKMIGILCRQEGCIQQNRESVDEAGFAAQETIISGLYIWETMTSLRPVLAMKGRRGKAFDVEIDPKEEDSGGNMQDAEVEDNHA